MTFNSRLGSGKGQTDGQTDNDHQCIMPLPYGGGGIINHSLKSLGMVVLLVQGHPTCIIWRVWNSTSSDVGGQGQGVWGIEVLSKIQERSTGGLLGGKNSQRRCLVAQPPETEWLLLSDKHCNSNSVHICVDYMICVHGEPIYPKMQRRGRPQFWLPRAISCVSLTEAHQQWGLAHSLVHFTGPTRLK